MTPAVKLLLLVLGLSDGLTHRKLLTTTGDAIPGQYLVLMKQGSQAAVDAAKARVLKKATSADPSMGFMDDDLLPPPDVSAPDVTQVIPLHTSSNAALKAVLDDPDVALVEPNQRIKLDCKPENTSIWSLARVSGRFANVSQFQHDGDGTNTIVYVIDTGVLTTHPEFEGRAQFGDCVWSSINPFADVTGHGTHVAGTVGGMTYGASKKVTIKSVRVFDDRGVSNTNALYNGIIWALNDHMNKNWILNLIGVKQRAKGVINMSLGFLGNSTAIESLLKNVSDHGMISVTAAGNDANDSCNYFPASSAYVVNVGCLDQNDTMCYFSNYGSCVDILAPGYDIPSADVSSSYSKLMSGTSMASPLVAGVIANYLSITSPTPTLSDVKAWLEATATRDVVSHMNEPCPRCNTTNHVLFSPCGDSGATRGAEGGVRLLGLFLAVFSLLGVLG